MLLSVIKMTVLSLEVAALVINGLSRGQQISADLEVPYPQSQPGSIVHVELHPSPFTKLPKLIL